MTTFAKFKPKVADHSASVTAVYADGTTRFLWGDRAGRAKYRIALQTLSTGATEYRVSIGLGKRRRRIDVTCTDADAFDYLEEWAARDRIFGASALRQGERYYAGRVRREAEGR